MPDDKAMPQPMDFQWYSSSAKGRLSVSVWYFIFLLILDEAAPWLQLGRSAAGNAASISAEKASGMRRRWAKKAGERGRYILLTMVRKISIIRRIATRKLKRDAQGGRGLRSNFAVGGQSL